MSHDARAIPSARRFRLLFGLAINTAGLAILFLPAGATLSGEPLPSSPTTLLSRGT